MLKVATHQFTNSHQPPPTMRLKQGLKLLGLIALDKELLLETKKDFLWQLEN